MTKKPFRLALHIFRRDLRLHDNTALISALQQSDQVIPCFIFDVRQIERNDYRGDHCLAFMLNSLKSLDAELSRMNSQLYFFQGTAEEIVDQLMSAFDIDAVFVNRDYTPFSRERDRNIENKCKARSVKFLSFADTLLIEPEEIAKNDKHPYTIFTPFYNKAVNAHIEKPQANRFRNYYQNRIENAAPFPQLIKKQTTELLLQGGRCEGLKLLKRIPKLKDYAKERDYPAKNQTTFLSAHHKFGTISIRETYFTVKSCFGRQHDLIKELYWRDFFTHVAFHFPHVFHGAFQKKFNRLHWENNEEKFQAWCDGKTGFPIVDAGMRQLKQTGFLPNRVRMIVGSFLVKDLLIDWRWGEKYFAQQLLDYDPSVNNGNWQWVASTGCDAQPYFRIFNPWLQQKKFDADCVYIKKWVPELKHFSADAIHQYDKPGNKMDDYPVPITNHTLASQSAKKVFRAVQQE